MKKTNTADFMFLFQSTNWILFLFEINSISGLTKTCEVTQNSQTVGNSYMHEKYQTLLSFNMSRRSEHPPQKSLVQFLLGFNKLVNFKGCYYHVGTFCSFHTVCLKNCKGVVQVEAWELLI